MGNLHNFQQVLLNILHNAAVREIKEREKNYTEQLQSTF